MSMAVGDDIYEQIVRRYLSLARPEVSRRQNNIFSNEGSGLQATCDNEQVNLAYENVVLNPKSKKPKGGRNLRFKEMEVSGEVLEVLKLKDTKENF
ncbi:hypothetical protein ACH5RR_003410 [Cinchona calisaya]|uniref:Uncharacterized protein n=1 Tax=Cinchona calisaya TaxID=153742 RepID=A0ABD3AVC3_9GENT